MEIDIDPLQKQMLDDVFDMFTMLAGGGIVSLMHVDGEFTRFTASAVELFGLSGEYVPHGAVNWADMIHPDDRERYLDVMGALASGESRTYDLMYRVRVATGDYVSFRVVGAVLRGSDGRPSLIGGAMFNEGLAYDIDPVTAMPNKNAFLKSLAEMIGVGERVCALQVGIDNFGEITRVQGYTFGNRVLQEAAWLIQKAVNERGKVYRLDGASFVALSNALTREDMAAIYDYVRIQLQRGIEVNGMSNVLVAKGGYISTLGSNSNAATIAACLEYACAESGERMHGQLVDFNGSLNYDQAESLEMIKEIRDNTSDGCKGFRLEYQPVVAVGTGNVNGVEGVICWENDRFGKVEADDFLPMLERDFVFEEIGDFILRQGLADGVKLLEKDPCFLLCLNVYRMQLESDYFIDELVYNLKESGFSARHLSLKFDSECRHVGMKRMQDVISKLHELGVLAIIDDFGTGADSIGFLKNEEADAVSIGAEFTRGIKDNAEDRKTLEFLVGIAANYIEHINVKGVDDAELNEIVSAFPATTMQGDYYSAPLPFDDLVARYYS